jgi:hypothetical protein
MARTAAPPLMAARDRLWYATEVSRKFWKWALREGPYEKDLTRRSLRAWSLLDWHQVGVYSPLPLPHLNPLECGHLDQQGIGPPPGLYIAIALDHLDGGDPVAAV